MGREWRTLADLTQLSLATGIRHRSFTVTFLCPTCEHSSDYTWTLWSSTCKPSAQCRCNTRTSTSSSTWPPGVRNNFAWRGACRNILKSSDKCLPLKCLSSMTIPESQCDPSVRRLTFMFSYSVLQTLLSHVAFWFLQNYFLLLNYWRICVQHLNFIFLPDDQSSSSLKKSHSISCPAPTVLYSSFFFVFVCLFIFIPLSFHRMVFSILNTSILSCNS